MTYILVNFANEKNSRHNTLVIKSKAFVYLYELEQID